MAHHQIPLAPHGILPGSPNMHFGQRLVNSAHGVRVPHPEPQRIVHHPHNRHHHPRHPAQNHLHIQHPHPAANSHSLAMPWHEGHFVSASQLLAARPGWDVPADQLPSLASSSWQDPRVVFPHGTPILHGSRVENPLQPHPWDHPHVFYTDHPDFNPHMYDTKMPKVVGEHRFLQPSSSSSANFKSSYDRTYYEDLPNHSSSENDDYHSSEPQIDPRAYDTPRPRNVRHHEFEAHLPQNHVAYHPHSPAAMPHDYMHSGHYSPYHQPHYSADGYYVGPLSQMQMSSAFMSTYNIHPPTPVPMRRPRPVRRRRQLRRTSIEPTMDKIPEDITENDTDSEDPSQTVSDDRTHTESEGRSHTESEEGYHAESEEQEDSDKRSKEKSDEDKNSS